MFGLIVPVEHLRPEDDTQELWMEYGRIEALKGFLRATRRKNEYVVSIADVEGIMGFHEEERCRRCGHPSSED